MKKLLIATIAVLLALDASAAKKSKVTPLQFNPQSGVKASLTMPDGKVVNYTAYTKLYFVTNVEDSTYQYMNLFVPDGVTQQSPMFLRTYVGGYMASEAGSPQAQDASGRALAEGYVLVIPGSRGRTSTVAKGKKTVYTGRAPKALLDLKAAVRYLRHFDSVIPGDAEKIIIDGTSAGGAMSSLMGATGNNAAYEPLLKAMGAAEERDDVFASVCYCPITDLDHADMAYEWLYGNTDSRKSLADSKQALSQELAAQFPTYINSLGLKKPDGSSLQADNYLDYVKQIIIRSAQEAKDAGADIPDSIGFSFSSEAAFQAPINGGVAGKKPQGMPGFGKKPEGMAGGMPPMMMGGGKRVGEYITDLDMTKYLNYVVSTQALKGVPAFDSYNVDGAAASGENGEFGNAQGSDANFTPWAAAKAGIMVSTEVNENVRLMNPMSFIGDGQTTVAPHWYIRHGARDRDTAFPVAINLATKLQNAGKDVNFKLPWNRPHSGDYALNELFSWIAEIVR
ncbi:MAG: alpha/beta hydrolase [Prevotella sp.]|nr:alpha/beta hydrolase [Prevotella sp.]